MDVSGLIRSYDSRPTSSAALTRAIMAPHYVTSHHQYSGLPSTNMMPHQPQQIQHNPFGFGAYVGANPNAMIPAFTPTYIQQRPLGRSMRTETGGSRGLSYARSTRQGFVEEHQSQSPQIKPEPHWVVPVGISSSPVTPLVSTESKNLTSNVPANGPTQVVFGTEIDTLMKAIQIKSEKNNSQTQTADPKLPVVGASTHPYAHPVSQSRGHASGETGTFKLTYGNFQDDSTPNSKANKKNYQCLVASCFKTFTQKTHLEIHKRSHNGLKPYLCTSPGCGRTFSQLGNLKTHERRHTGERPYECEICHKRFAQRGNIRAHKNVHEQAKPFLCRLDDCNKKFTQLGNLKSHQNKFHIVTIRKLTEKFSSIRDEDLGDNNADKELWEYFANLYKNSNKGIKGRGKDRKVGSNPMALTSSMRNLAVGNSGGYGMSGPGRGNTGVSMMNSQSLVPTHHQSREGQYDMYDVDEESQSGRSGSGGSVTTLYDEPAENFEDNSRGGDHLAFGDRIY